MKIPRQATLSCLVLVAVLLGACGSSTAPRTAPVTVTAASSCGAAAVAATPDPLPPDYPSAPAGRRYYAEGPCGVSAQTRFACCDSSGNAFDIWYPSAVITATARFPVITWGDGTLASPGNYAQFLAHLASWGFIVIASESETTHTGQEMLDAANTMIALDRQPGSAFYGKVATDRIGTIGHSQGAGAATRLAMYSASIIKAAIAIERPAQSSCNGDDCPSTANIAVPIFYVNGSEDGISPSSQTSSCIAGGQSNEQSNACFYLDTPDIVEKAWGTLNGPNHNDVEGQPSCGTTPLTSQGTCTYGVYGYLGYPTAWMMAQLQDDADARAAFTPGGDFFADTSWSNQLSDLR